MEKKRKIHHTFSYNSLIALLQGKRVHIEIQDTIFVFEPPFNGMFLTHEEIDQMLANNSLDTFLLLEKLRVHKE